MGRFGMLLKVHLALYNQFQSIGWLLVAIAVLYRGLVDGASLRWAVTVLQMAVWLDVVHVLIGVWPENDVSLLQRLWCKVGHRTELYISISLASDSVLDGSAFGFLLLTWALADVFRFQFYFLRTLDWPVPRWLEWIRYSTFILQYPLVVLGEAFFVSRVFDFNLSFVAISMIATISVAALLPATWSAHSANLKWTAFVALSMSGIVWSLNLGYAPIAMLFQFRQWLILAPSFYMLFKMRQKRLFSKTKVAKKSLKSTAVQIRPAGPEVDGIVCQHWRQMWMETMAPKFRADFNEITMEFIRNGRKELNYQTFVARYQGHIVGSVSCQIWAGPMPLVVRQKTGSVWAVYTSPEHRHRGVATALMRRVIQHWRMHGCQTGLLLFASENGKRVYEQLGFTQRNMMLVDLPTKVVDVSSLPSVTSIEAGSDDHRALIQNWREMILETGSSEDDLEARWSEKTRDFVAQATGYQGFCVKEDDFVVGSVACNLWRGPIPLVLKDSVFKLGTLWGLYVHPSRRRRGVAKALVNACIEHWQSLGCTRGIVVLPHEHGALSWSLFDKLNFSTSNAMTIDLTRPLRDAGCDKYAVAALRDAGVAGTDERRLKLLLHALPQQLEAAFGASEPELVAATLKVQANFALTVDRSYFDANVRRMGRGFDMTSLNSTACTSKFFDRLASKYDSWSIGNKSQVESFVSRQCRKNPELESASVLDVCCGIGLMSHQLRLMRFNGVFTATDISPAMVAHATSVPGVFDGDSFVCDVNLGLPPALADSFELVLCLGAMELLNQSDVLRDFARVLKSRGHLWTSFQAEGTATAHQNVFGISENAVRSHLEAAGFHEIVIELCKDAFYTPSALQDGSLVPVPYYFCTAILK